MLVIGKRYFRECLCLGKVVFGILGCLGFFQKFKEDFFGEERIEVSQVEVVDVAVIK